MNRLAAPAMAAGFLVLTASAAGALGIAKGPYLMSPTLSGITVCWVSGANAKGTVEYAAEGGPASSGVAREEAVALYHRVALHGLRAYTRYRYRVECEGQ